MKNVVSTHSRALRRADWPQALAQFEATLREEPDDVEALKALLLAEREAHRVALREQALNIEQLRQTIAKLRHDRFGASSERRALLGQLELSLFDLEEDQAEAETRHEINASQWLFVSQTNLSF